MLFGISFPDSVEAIEDDAFDECKGLEVLVFPDHLKRIGNSAFDSCAALTDVFSPEGLEEIGGRAFDKCKCLKQVTLSEATVIAYDSFPYFVEIERTIHPAA